MVRNNGEMMALNKYFCTQYSRSRTSELFTENGDKRSTQNENESNFIHMMAEISPNGLCRLKKASLPEEESVKSLTFPNFDNSGIAGSGISKF